MSSMAVVRQKYSRQFLQMSKLDPATQAPVYGPLEMDWIADSEELAKAQAAILGDGDDHEVVRVVSARPDLSQFANDSKEDAEAVVANCNIRIAFKP